MTAIANPPGARQVDRATWDYRRFNLHFGSGMIASRGGLACIDTSIADATTARVRPGTASTTLIPIGTFAEFKDNSAGSAVTPVNVRLFREVLITFFVNDTGGGAIAGSGIGLDCYILDDETVSATSTGHSVAGRVWYIDPQTLQVGVEFHQ